MSDIVLNNITSGYNLSKINSNFATLQNAYNDVAFWLSGGNNTMQQDIDLNSNDLLNVNNISTQTLVLNGNAVVPGNLGSFAPNSVGTAQVIDGSITDPKIVSVSSSKATFQQTGSVVVRFLQDRGREVLSAKDFGVVGDGFTNDTSNLNIAIAAAITQKKTLYLPVGTYVHDPLTANGSLWIVGDGPGNTTMRLRSTGNAITFTNTNFAGFSDMTFDVLGGPQSIAGSNGPTFQGSCNNSYINNCQFQGFAGWGLGLIGTSLNSQSGMQVYNSVFLGNGGAQLNMSYSNDFHIQNNQYGSLQGVASATFGAFLDNCNAGNYLGNYHWSNAVGFAANACSYNRILGNRMEMNNFQGVSYTSGTFVTFTNNTLHTNSLASIGNFNNADFTGMNSFICSNNNSFDWSGGASHHKIGINITSSSNVTISRNKCANFDPSAGAPILVDGITTPLTSPDCSYVSATSAAIPTNTTTFLGPVGAQNPPVHWVVDRPCTINRVYVAPYTVPGAGQSFSYTLRKNGVDTAVSGVISDTSTFSISLSNVTPAIVFAKGDFIDIKVTSSNGASASQHRYCVELLEY